MPFDATPQIEIEHIPGPTEQTLIDARKLIENPEKWGKGNGDILNPRDLGLDAYCALTAISAAECSNSEGRADIILEEVVGVDFIGAWNDAAERTHAEVLAAFDKAIARARLENC